MITVRKILRKILVKAGNILLDLSGKVYQFPGEKRVIAWVKDEGDKTHRLNYALNENSVVFDLGGFEGQWASDIFAKYCCSIHIFEPVSKFAQNIKQRFAQNNKVFVHEFGLASESKRENIFLDENGSSLYRQGNDFTEIFLMKAVDFMKENNIIHIDLMKINIEGGEYDLLQHLIDTGFIKNISDIQVQFHDYVENAEVQMAEIQNRLSSTHYLTYQYPFVWENWRAKGLNSQ